MIGKLAQALRGRGLRKGVIGGNSRWMTVWVAIAAAQFMHKRLKAKPVIERFELKPGETITITDLGLPEPAP